MSTAKTTDPRGERRTTPSTRAAANPTTFPARRTPPRIELLDLGDDEVADELGRIETETGTGAMEAETANSTSSPTAEADSLFVDGLSPSILMTPSMSDLDFGLFSDGDFAEDIGTLLPPPVSGEMIVDDVGATGMDVDGSGLDDVELIYSQANPAAATAAPPPGGAPGPMALTDKAYLFGGDNSLSLKSVFPNAGAKFSPLRQFEMLDSKQSRHANPPRAASPTNLRLPNTWGGGSGAGAASAEGAIVPYQPGVMVKREADPDDFDLPALEYSQWDAAQREQIRKNPPRSMKTITDFELAYVDLKDLNELMDREGYTEEQKRQAKLRRRKVKNRNSAKGSATKKRTQFNSIAQTNKQLLDVVSELQNRNTKLATANNELQQQTEEARQVAAAALQEKEAFQREIERLTARLSEMQSQSEHGSPLSHAMSP